MMTKIAKDQLQKFDWLSRRLDSHYREMDRLLESEATLHDKEISGLHLNVLGDLFRQADDFLNTDGLSPGLVQYLPNDKISVLDAAALAGQYVAALEAYRAQRVEVRYGALYWRVESKPKSTSGSDDAAIKIDPNVEYVPVVLKGDDGATE